MTDERWENLMREVGGLLDRRDLDSAQRLLADMIRRQADERGEDDPGTAGAQVTLAFVYDELGRSQEAQALMAAAEANLLQAGESGLLIQCLSWRAGMWMEKRGYAAAESLYRHCVDLADDNTGVSPFYTLNCRKHLASALLALGRRQEAIELLGQAVEPAEALTSSEALLAGEMSVLLGELHLGDGQLAEAGTALNQALELYGHVPDAENAELARLHCDLGRVELAEGRLNPAEKQFKRAISLVGDALADGGSLAFPSQYGLGLVRRYQRRHAEAREVLRQALDAAQKAEISDLDLLQSCLAATGRVCLELHLYEEAEAHLTRALSLAERSGQKTDAEMHHLRQSLSQAREGKAVPPGQRGIQGAQDLLRDLSAKAGEAALKDPRHAHQLVVEAIDQNQHGRWERGVWCYQAAQRILENGLGHEQEAVADCLHAQAQGLLKQDLAEQAEQAVREAMAILHRINHQGRVSGSMMLSTLGAVLLSREEYADAEVVLRQAVAGFEAAGQPEDAALAMMNLAVACQADERGDEAEGWYLRALGILDRPGDGDRPNAELATHLEQVAAFYTGRGEYDKAEAVLNRAVEVAIATGGEQAPRVEHLRQKHRIAVRQLTKPCR